VSAPRVLTIAGSDSGGGAGIQADLKTFAAHGVYGMSVVTAVTAQNTRGVHAVHEVPAEVVRAQLAAVLDDLGADAVKVGMLGNAAIVAAVADELRRVTSGARRVPLVVDPVLVAKGGAALLRDDAVERLRSDLLPHATVVTPNLPEAERLTGMRVASEEQRVDAARALAGVGCAVLLKGGHGEGDEIVDLLVDGERVVRFAHRRQATRSTHGTGCTLSAAIAARLARGDALEDAIAGAVDYVQRAIAAAPGLGAGHGPLEHGVAPAP